MRRTLWILPIVFFLGACTGGGGSSPPPDPAATRNAARSVALLDRIISGNGTGCSAAIGVEGRVVWSGSRGIADLASGERLTDDTVFDIGSVSKQFTAAAILLLAADGKLSIDDAVAKHLPGLPEWGSRVTITQLIHHTSGVPDYYEPLVERGYPLSQHVSHAQTVDTIAAMPALEFQPGQQFEYSHSNYVLLAEIAHRASGTPLPQLLRERIFAPLGLTMVLDPDGAVARKATSYYVDLHETETLDHHWSGLGDSGIQTTPRELVRWGDNYRTGAVGGSRLLQAQLAGPVETDFHMWAHNLGVRFTYAGGILLADDATLVQPGTPEGFSTAFEIRPDRRTVIAVSCNSPDHIPDVIAAELRKIWTQ